MNQKSNEIVLKRKLVLENEVEQLTLEVYNVIKNNKVRNKKKLKKRQRKVNR